MKLTSGAIFWIKVSDPDLTMRAPLVGGWGSNFQGEVLWAHGAWQRVWGQVGHLWSQPVGQAQPPSVLYAVMSTFLPDPPLPPPLGSWPRHPVLCRGLCLGYLWGTGQGTGDFRRHWRGAPSLGKFLTAPEKQACTLPAPLSMDQGQQFIHPGSR